MKAANYMLKLAGSSTIYSESAHMGNIFIKTEQKQPTLMLSQVESAGFSCNRCYQGNGDDPA